MKNKNKKFDPLSEGLARIEEIKNNISSYGKPKLAKAQVYQMWEDIFETDEQ